MNIIKLIILNGLNELVVQIILSYRVCANVLLNVLWLHVEYLLDVGRTPLHHFSSEDYFALLVHVLPIVALFQHFLIFVFWDASGLSTTAHFFQI